MQQVPVPHIAGAGYSVAIFLVVVASYIIAWWSSRKNRDTRVNTYLFAGNTAALGLSSSVGTIISMAVGFTALLSAGFVFGWQILFSILPGGGVGLWVILRFINTPIIHAKRTEALSSHWKYGASYLAFLSKDRPKSSLAYYSVAMFFYVAMLATEVAVLRGALRFFLGVDKAELVMLLGAIIAVCISYVYIGGFRGVLVTDYFQLLVVIAFIGSVLPHVVRLDLFESIPTPTVAAIHWTPTSLVILHIGAFFGAFAWTAGNLDQWFRTLGTLPEPTARRTLRLAAIVIYTCTILPILAGSVAAARGLPPSIGNTASLHLLLALWQTEDPTGRFLFVATIGCAALTTLNTYVMTMQQLYYEFCVTMVAETPYQYIAEWLLKWPSVRKAIFILTAGSVAVSLLISDANVYLVGVFASCGYIFLALPILLSLSQRIRVMTQPVDVRALASALIFFALLLFILRSWTGAIAVHLYVLPAAAGMAICISIALKALSAHEEQAS